MSDPETTTTSAEEDPTADQDPFELLGRRAGAELRTAPPKDGAQLVRGAVTRRRTALVASATALVIVVLVLGLLFVTRERREARLVPPTPTTAPTDPPTPPTSPPTIPPSPPETTEATTPVTAGTAAAVPGTWRMLATIPDDLTALPEWTVWTGTEAIILGIRRIDEPLVAMAFSPSSDAWRRLADPPPAFTAENQSYLAARWTGSVVLTALNNGDVYAYDPSADRWELRAAADSAGVVAGSGFSLGVSSRGVVVRTNTDWRWYDVEADAWSTLAAPPAGFDDAIVTTVDDDRIAITSQHSGVLWTAVLDTEALTWRRGPDATGLSDSTIRPRQCEGIDGRLVCNTDGLGRLEVVIVDFGSGSVQTAGMGSHSNMFPPSELPWLAHAWRLLSPRTATWQSISPLTGVTGFAGSFWTGTEIVFFGGIVDNTGEPTGITAAYTPFDPPS